MMARMAKLAEWGLPRRIGRSRAPTFTRPQAGCQAGQSRGHEVLGLRRFARNPSAGNRWVRPWARSPFRLPSMATEQPTKRRPLPRPWGRRHRAGMQFMGLERHVRIAYRVVVAVRHHLRLARQAVVLPPRTVAQARHRPSGLTRDRCGCRPTAPHGLTDRLCVHGLPIRSRKLPLISVYLK